MFRSFINWLNKQLKRDFSLDDFMVFVVVVVVMALTIFAFIRGTGEKTRDEKRKTDLKEIAGALELYKTKYGHYPKTGKNFLISARAIHSPRSWLACGSVDCSGPNEKPDSFADDYFSGHLPTDPLNRANMVNPLPTEKTADGENYTYAYFSDGKCYNLWANLETSGDSETCGKRNYVSNCPVDIGGKHYDAGSLLCPKTLPDSSQGSVGTLYSVNP